MQPIKLPSEIRLPNSQPINRVFDEQNFLEKETEREFRNIYLEIITGHDYVQLCRCNFMPTFKSAETEIDYKCAETAITN